MTNFLILSKMFAPGKRTTILNTRSKLLLKSAGAAGLGLIPLCFALFVLVDHTGVMEIPSFVRRSPLVLGIVSCLAIGVTALESKVRILLSTASLAMIFLWVGGSFSWYEGREVLALLFRLLFFLSFCFGIGRETRPAKSPDLFKWGLLLLVGTFPLMSVPPLGLFILGAGLLTICLAFFRWASELFESARQTYDNDQPFSKL